MTIAEHQYDLITARQSTFRMSGLRPWEAGDIGSDDGDVVSHDSAGEIEDTKGALEMLMKSGPPSTKVGMPDNLIEGVAKPEEIAEIIVKTERIKGESGSFFSFVSDVAGKIVKRAIDDVTGFATSIEFNGLRDRVKKLEDLFRDDTKGKKVADTGDLGIILSRLDALEKENEHLRRELDKISIDFAEFSAGAREIYDTFQADRVIQPDPRLDDLMAELAKANKERDDALKKAGSTPVSSGGTAKPTNSHGAHRRSNPAKATTVAEFQARFTPPLTRAEAARRFKAGER